MTTTTTQPAAHTTDARMPAVDDEQRDNDHLMACLHNNHAAVGFLTRSGGDEAAKAILILRSANKLLRLSVERNRLVNAEEEAQSQVDGDVCIDDYMTEHPPCANDSDVSRFADCGNEGVRFGMPTSTPSPNNHYVHRHPIVIPEAWMRQPTCRNNLLASVAIIYNLALAHHAYAEQQLGMDDAAGLFDKAAQLYKHAFNLFRSQFDSCLQNNPQFYMGTINNLAHLALSMGHRDVAYQYLEQLLATLMYFLVRKRDTFGGRNEYRSNAPRAFTATNNYNPVAGNAQQQNFTLHAAHGTPSEYEGFLHSVSCLVLQNLASPPAPAA